MSVIKNASSCMGIRNRRVSAAVLTGTLLCGVSVAGCRTSSPTNITRTNFKGDASKMPQWAKDQIRAAQGSAAQRGNAGARSGGVVKLDNKKK